MPMRYMRSALRRKTNHMTQQRLVLSFLTLLITACVVLSIAAIALVAVLAAGG